MRQIVRLALIALFISLPLSAQPTEAEKAKENELAAWIKANYTKYEYRIPMRDGKRLFTAVYVPKDDSEKWPILLNRTPYSVSPYGPDNYKRSIGPSDHVAKAKYIIVYQDVRGRFMSEGEFLDMRPHNPAKKSSADVDESSDTYDTIDWLVKNTPNHNGKAGIWGISYPGFYAAAAIIDAHPALKASSPQAPIADWFIGDDFHHNGAYFLAHSFEFFRSFGVERPDLTKKWPLIRELEGADGYEFYLNLIPLSRVNERYYEGRIRFWNEVLEHPNYDAFWKARNLPQHFKNIKPAVMTVGGLFDAEDVYGTFATYQGVEKNNPSASNSIVIGPWSHGGWSRSEGEFLGNARFAAATAAYYREQIELPFFEYHLKGKGVPKLPEARVFETGTNVWRRYDSWPPRNVRQQALYFSPRGKLTLTAPQSEGLDEYVSDPAKPVPFIADTSMRMTKEYMTDDQRLHGRRTDVLVYATEPLEEDLTIAGPIRAVLNVSTSGTDSDWIVKVIDVYPADFPDADPNPARVRMGGYQQLIRGEPMRGRFRNSFETPEPFEPGKPAKIDFVMPDVNHTFRSGHRIMVQVQSTWFPLIDINPQTFVPNIFKATEADFKKATQRVFHGSHVIVGVVKQ